MTIRKHDDSVKPGCGIDSDLGEDFTRTRTTSWNVTPAAGPAERAFDNNDNKKGDRWCDDSRSDPGLRNKLPAESTDQGTGSRNLHGVDIWNDVEGQSSDGGDCAVKSRGQA